MNNILDYKLIFFKLKVVKKNIIKIFRLKTSQIFRFHTSKKRNKTLCFIQ